jgi:hypothetical protein
MPDIKTQLRTYFDETAERVTPEDVRIRATTDWGVSIPSPRFRPRPLAAGAIGFGLAMTLLGIVLVVDRVFGGGVADVGGTGGPGVVTTSDPGSPWLFIPVVLGLGLLATGVISARRRNGDVRERGERTMQTIEKVGPAEAPFDNEMMSLKKRSRWLGWLAGILAVAVVGFGVLLIVGAGSEGASLPAAVEGALDDYSAAWNVSDGAALLESTTEGYQFVENGQVNGRTAMTAALVASGYFRTEQLDRVVTGSGPYYVAQTERIQLSSAGESYLGASMYRIVEVDGSWKIQRHVWIGENP